MTLSFFFVLFIFIQDQIPFKAKEDFNVKLNYAFKQRPSSENTTFHFETSTKERDSENSSGVLPYLILNLKITKATASEVRIKVVTNLNTNLLTKKIQNDFELPIDIGFTDDVKDRVTAHEYIVYFLNDKKKEQSKIVIFVEEDGTFLVNGELRGKL